MESKADLVNNLVYRLADKVEMPISELKAAIEISMYEYNIEKIATTELTVGGAGNITDQLWLYFEIGKLSQNITRGTLDQYKLVVYQLCTLIGKELNLITSDDVKVFLLKMKMINGCSDVTVNNKRLNLSSVFSYLYAHEKIARNPMNKVDKIKCCSRIKQPLSEIEVEVVLMSCGALKDDARKREVALMYFLLDTGVRVSELCSLDISSLDFQNRSGIVLGKGNKERYIYFSPRTEVRLNDYLKTREDAKTRTDVPLFASLKKPYKRMNKSGIENILRHLGKMSGVYRLHPHLVRATFATNLSKKGVPIEVIAKLLGHANLNTIHRYVLVTDDFAKTKYLP